MKQLASEKGLLFGSSAASWQLVDPAYAALFVDQSAMLFTEDDLLWYRLKPTLSSPLDFLAGDRIIGFAQSHGQPVFGAHLVWDEGFGSGWPERTLWELTGTDAAELLFGTIHQTVDHYRGKIAIWSCANEVVANGPDTGLFGLRTDVPWMATIGESYVAKAFEVAHEADPEAVLVLNDFGYETANQYGDRPEDKRRNTLEVLDRLLAADVPLHAFGIQGHLLAEAFPDRFNASDYRTFLRELADRGLVIFITELDVLDDGLAPDVPTRDIAIADVYHRFLEATLDEPAVKAVLTFGLSDRYTWLQEDFPRLDGAERRPLPFDSRFQAKAALDGIRKAIAGAPYRAPLPHY